MSQFSSVEEMITSVAPVQTTANDTSACTLILTVPGSNGETFSVALASNIFMLDQEPIQRGDIITTLYNTMAPIPPVHLPQYWAVALVKTRMGQNAILGFFDWNLLSSDGTLRLGRSGPTNIQLQDRQRFLGALGNQLLLMVYNATTRSVPAQTTLSQIVVFYSVEQGRETIGQLPGSHKC